MEVNVKTIENAKIDEFYLGIECKHPFAGQNIRNLRISLMKFFISLKIKSLESPQKKSFNRAQYFYLLEIYR